MASRIRIKKMEIGNPKEWRLDYKFLDPISIEAIDGNEKGYGKGKNRERETRD